MPTRRQRRRAGSGCARPQASWPSRRPATSSTTKRVAWASRAEQACRRTSWPRRSQRAGRAPCGVYAGAVRTVYMGTSEFAVAVLRRLAACAHSPVLVVTRPDRPRGRGRKLQAPPVAEAARELGIEVFQPASVNDEDSRARIAVAQPDEVLICAFGALIRDPLLSEHPMLNVHPSLLPRWRGAAPIERAIDAGDEVTGATIMPPIAELDAGPMCLQRDEPIRPDDDYGSLAPRLAALGGELLVEVLDSSLGCP